MITQPSLPSIVEHPYDFGSLRTEISASIAEAERLASILSSDRYSLYEFKQVMRYATNVLHPAALGILTTRLADPQASQAFCADARSDKFSDPVAARLWAFLEVIPAQQRRDLPDKVLEFWLRHPSKDIQDIGIRVVRSNRTGIPLESIVVEEIGPQEEEKEPAPLPAPDISSFLDTTHS